MVPQPSEYRYPGEQSALAIAFIALCAAVFGVLAVSLGVAAVVIVVGIAMVRLRQGQLLGNSATVGPGNHEPIARLAAQSASALGAPTTRVHVRQDPYLNAFAVGYSEPYSIVLHSAVVESLDERELLFILGHETGHIRAGHTGWLSMIAPLGTTIPGFDLIFGVWQRRAEYTCDRAGLIVSKDVNASVRALIKISAGPNALQHTDVGNFLRQSESLSSGRADRIGELLGTHPYVVNRIRRLLEFHESPQGARLCADAAPPAGDAHARECSRCSRPTLADDRFCVACGGQAIDRPGPSDSVEPDHDDTPTCTACDESLLADARFCVACGAVAQP